MKTLLIIGGTTEARTAAKRLEEDGYRVVVSVATSLGELYAADAEVVAGPKDDKGLARQVRECEALAVLDCTHPFAVDASEAARRAAAATGIPYLRYTRAASNETDGVAAVDNWSAAVEFLSQQGERALLTIGVRHLEPFAAAGLDFAARVLPLPDSVSECIRIGLRPEDIIAAFPPYDVDFNRACIRKAGARIMVMKDSGREGGIPQKIAAAAAEAIPVVMVRRPSEDQGLVDIEELVTCVNEVVVS